MNCNNRFSSSFHLYLIFFLSYIIYGVESYTPDGRLGHSSVVVGNKLYIFGGITNSNFGSNEAFYLDLSGAFDVSTNTPWTLGPPIPFESSWAAAASNNNDAYLIGGLMNDVNTHRDSFQSLVYKLNSLTTWNAPSISGTSPQRRIEMKAVSNSGKIYMFGGAGSRLTGGPLRFFNEMIILDTAGSSWQTIPTSGAIKGRTSYSATLLPNGVIVFIGGLELGDNNVFQLPDISQLILFDTKSSNWITKTATFKNQVESRLRHSAVLGQNGQIIVYGGTKFTASKRFTQPVPDLAVLSTNNDNYEWSTPSPSLGPNVGQVPSLAGHTADVVGNFMIVAFGNMTRPNDDPLPNKNARVYLMDIRSFTWVNAFDPGSSSSGSPTIKIIIASVCGVVGSIIIMVGGYFAYKWFKKRRKNDTSTGFPGTNTEPTAEYNNYAQQQQFPYNAMPVNSAPSDTRYSNYSNNPMSDTTSGRQSVASGYQAPAQLGMNYNPQSGNYNPHHSGMSYNNPQSGMNYNPQSGMNYNPQSGMNYNNPQSGMNYNNPQSGMNYNPQSGMNYNPQSGMNFNNPQSAGIYNPQPGVETPHPGTNYNPQPGTLSMNETPLPGSAYNIQ